LNYSLSLSLSLSLSHTQTERERERERGERIFQTLEHLLSDDTMSDHSGEGPVGHTVSRTVTALGGSLFGRWVALSKPRASSSHLDSDCWTRENLGRRTDTPRIRKASVLTHASRSVRMYRSDIHVYISACKCTYEWMYWESSEIFKWMKFDLVAKILDGYLCYRLNLSLHFLSNIRMKSSRMFRHLRP